MLRHELVLLVVYFIKVQDFRTHENFPSEFTSEEVNVKDTEKNIESMRMPCGCMN